MNVVAGYALPPSNLAPWLERGVGCGIVVLVSTEQKTPRPQSPLQEEPQRLTLALVGMGKQGETLAFDQGEPLLVLGGIPGEEVVVEVLKTRRARVAQVVQVLKPSPHRVSAPCPYYGPCTGCQWQHIAYEHQLELKRQRLQREFDQAPELGPVTVLPTLPAPEPYHYRNHARFTIKGGALGFVNRFTRRFLPVERCLLMHPWINDALAQLQDRCEETTQVSIRYGENTGEWLIQPRLKRADIPLATGQSHYEEALLGNRFRVAGSSFFQVNTRQTERLVELVVDRLRLSGQEFLVDAYAGVGTLAILLAPYARRVIAIEDAASAVRDAIANAHGLAQVEFLQAKTEEALGQLPERPDAVVLDPPRVGCRPEALEALKRLAPPRVVYISCDPEALVRDLRQLCPDPYRVEEVQPVDMFPQTHHVEAVATLALREGS